MFVLIFPLKIRHIKFMSDGNDLKAPRSLLSKAFKKKKILEASLWFLLIKKVP